MLADQIKRHRKAAGLTQSEFAKRFHVATGTIGMWETGRREPNYRTLVKLAVFFGVSVDELLGEEEPPGAAEESGARVPVYAALRAGASEAAFGEVIGYEDFPCGGAAAYFGLRVPDSAMYPEYLAGDIVIARRQDDARSGEDALVSVGGEEAVLRRVWRLPEGLLLLALNAGAAPAFYSAEQVCALPVRILGVCVELRRKKNTPALKS